MLLIPAIDMKDGQCVRLKQGRMDDATIYSDDPVAMAKQWEAKGARRIHLVDLDGAFAGKPKNGELVKAICAAVDCEVEIGGGIRNIEIAEAYLDAGVDYVIIGSAAVKDPNFVIRLAKQHPGKVIIGLDAKDGKVATEGWDDVSELDVEDLAKKFEGCGVDAIIYTDIGRDGMLSGFNVEATAALGRATDIPVIASGGIRDLDDIHALNRIASDNVCGAILGRSIYENTLDFEAALQVAATATTEG